MCMKKIILSTFAIYLSSIGTVFGQFASQTNTGVASLCSMDIYGAIPVNDCGWGGGMNVLSRPLNIGYLNYKTPVQARIGGEFYLAMMSHKRLGSVPLTSQPNGNAKVNLYDNVFGLNAMVRFSLPYSSIVTPYVDVFGGLRGFSANMNITPEVHVQGQEETTSKNLSSTAHFNYGATFGLLVSINEWVKFNAGMMYTYSDKTGEIVNVKKAYVQSGNIIGENMLTRHGVFVAKVGFTFLLDWDNDGTSNRSCSGHRSSTFFGIGGGGLGTGGGRSNSVNFNFKPTK